MELSGRWTNIAYVVLMMEPVVCFAELKKRLDGIVCVWVVTPGVSLREVSGKGKRGGGIPHVEAVH